MYRTYRWILLSIILAVFTAPIVFVVRGCQPKLTQSLDNPDGTLTAHVYKQLGGASFDGDDHLVFLQALPPTRGTPEAEVIIIEGASLKEMEGPKISWLNATTLHVAFDLGETKGHDFQEQYQVPVTRGNEKFSVTVKLLRSGEALARYRASRTYRH